MTPELSDAVLAASLEHVQSCILLANDEQRFVYANPAASRLLGYTKEELLGMSVWDITPTPDLETAKELWGQFLEEGAQRGDYRIARKDGVIRVFRYSAVANVVEGIHLSDLQDITDLVDAEEAQRRRVKDRELLIREMQHRIGNMLATTRSVLHGQAARSSSPEVRDMVARVSARIRSMAEVARAMRHAQTIGESVALADVLEEVARTTVGTVAVEPEQVEVEVDAPGCQASWEELGPLALFVGEALTNFLKHSLPEDEELTVALRGELDDGKLHVHIDFSRPFSSDPSTWGGGFGVRLMDKLVDQLEGHVRWVQRADSSSVQLWLPRPESVPGSDSPGP